MSFIVIAESATLSWISYVTVSQVRGPRIGESAKGIRSKTDSVSFCKSKVQTFERHLKMYHLKDKVLEEQLCTRKHTIARGGEQS